MTRPREIALPIYEEMLPPGLAELPTWMDAIGAQIYTRLQTAPAGTIANSEMVASAARDIQRTLAGEGDDPSHLRESLPQMAERAAIHPHAREFVMFTAPDAHYSGPSRGVPIQGIQTFIGPIIRAANTTIKQTGALPHNYDFLEQIAGRSLPSKTRQHLAGTAMPETRDFLIETILGPSASNAKS